MMGSGGLVVIDEDTCIVDIAKYFIEFTADESCGKCTTCREGSYAILDGFGDGPQTAHCRNVRKMRVNILGQQFEMKKEKICKLIGICRNLINYLKKGLSLFCNFRWTLPGAPRPPNYACTLS